MLHFMPMFLVALGTKGKAPRAVQEHSKELPAGLEAGMQLESVVWAMHVPQHVVSGCKI